MEVENIKLERRTTLWKTARLLIVANLILATVQLIIGMPLHQYVFEALLELSIIYICTNRINTNPLTTRFHKIS